MAALCLRAPNTNVGIKGQRRRPRSSRLARSLALSLFLARSLLSRSLSLCLTHTHSHTHTHRGTDWRKARELDTRAHTQQRGRCPEARTDPAWGLQPRRLQRMGARARGWDGLLWIYPATRQISGEKKFFPLLKRRSVHYSSWFVQRKKRVFS